MSESSYQVSELNRDEQREIVRNLKKMVDPKTSPEERLRGGREWLAGKESPSGKWLEVPGGPRVRIVEVPQARGTLLDIHGGGWCLGTALSDEERLVRLGQATGLNTVSVDYRLAPEHPYPAGPEDCLKAARWLLQREPEQKLYLRGASAGAHLAVTTLLGLKAEARRFSGAVLYYGVYDLTGTPSHVLAREEDHPDLPPSSLEELTAYFVGNHDRRELSPLYADLENMPPALMLVGTQDILLDDTLFLAARWAAAGNEVELVVYPDAPHGFDGYPTEMGRDAQRREEEFLSS